MNHHLLSLACKEQCQLLPVSLYRNFSRQRKKIQGQTREINAWTMSLFISSKCLFHLRCTILPPKTVTVLFIKGKKNWTSSSLVWGAFFTLWSFLSKIVNCFFFVTFLMCLWVRKHQWETCAQLERCTGSSKSMAAWGLSEHKLSSKHGFCFSPVSKK